MTDPSTDIATLVDELKQLVAEIPDLLDALAAKIDDELAGGGDPAKKKDPADAMTVDDHLQAIKR